MFKSIKPIYDLVIYVDEDNLRRYLRCLHSMSQDLVTNLSYSDRPTIWRVLRNIADHGAREALVAKFLDTGMGVIQTTWEHSCGAAFPNLKLQAYESRNDVLLLAHICNVEENPNGND